MLSASELEATASQHTVAADAAVFAPDDGADLVTLHLRSRGRWIAETVPVEAVRNLPDGSFEVDLRVVSTSWLEHLLLGSAADVLAVRPQSVAVSVARTARAALKAYGEIA